MDGFRNKTEKVQENISSALHMPNLHYITCTHLYFVEYPNSLRLTQGLVIIHELAKGENDLTENWEIKMH